MLIKRNRYLFATLFFTSFVLFSSINASSFDLDLATKDTTQGFKIWTSDEGFTFANDLSYAGKINGDSIPDLIIGAPYLDYFKGAVFVIYGGTHTSDIDISSPDFSPNQGFKIYDSNPDTYGFGFSVSNAGDFNGDSIDDILIGAPDYDNGAAFVIYGTSDLMSDIDINSGSFSPNQGFKIYDSSGEEGALGTRIISVGDINGDNIDDIIIGAPTDPGSVFVIYGSSDPILEIDVSSSTFSPSQGFKMWDSSLQRGPGLGGWSPNFGQILSSGDVNGDNINDIIIGANSVNAHRGIVYVIYGTTSLMSDIDLGSENFTPEKGFKIYNSQGMQFDRLGTRITAGNLNGDKYSDLIISAIGESGMRGAVYIVYGSDELKSEIDVGSEDFRVSQGFKISNSTADQSQRFGSSLAVANLDGDSIDDIVIGVLGSNTESGRVTIVYGRDYHISEMDVEQLSSCANLGFNILDSTASTNDKLGTSISTARDMNGDMKDDIIIGFNDKDSQGSAYVVYGKERLECPSNCICCALPTICQTCSSGFELTPDNKCKNPLDAIEPEPKPEEEIETDPEPETKLPVPRREDWNYNFSNTREVLLQSTDSIQEITSILASILSIGNSVPLRTNLANKLVQRTRFSDIQYSPELHTVFKGIQPNIAGIIPPTSVNENMNSKPLPSVFSRYEVSPSFLANYWGVFWFLVIGIVIFAITKTVMIFKKKEDNVVLKFLSLAAFNFFLIILYGSLDDILLFGILDMRSTLHNSALSNFSLALAIIFALIGVIMLALYFKFLRHHQNISSGMKIAPVPTQDSTNLKKNNEYLRLLYQDFDNSSSIKLAFFIFFVFRSMITGLIYATLFDHPLAQTILLLIMSSAMIIGLAIQKPFKEKTNLYFQLFLEIVVFLVYFFDFILVIMDQAESLSYRAREKICMGVIVLIAFLVLVNIVFLLAKIFEALNSGFTFLKSEQIYKSVKIHSEPVSPTDISRKPTIEPDQI